MPKYRLLTPEELVPLKQDFVNYLVVNGITKDDWEKLKRTDKEASKKIIDSFSDVVFEKILREVKFLERIDKHQLFCFKCEPEEISLIALTTKDSRYDFSTAEGIALAKNAPPKDLKKIVQTKPYAQERQLEIFDLIQKGCEIADGQLFLTLEG